MKTWCGKRKSEDVIKVESPATSVGWPELKLGWRNGSRHHKGWMRSADRKQGGFEGVGGKGHVALSSTQVKLERARDEESEECEMVWAPSMLRSMNLKK